MAVVDVFLSTVPMVEETLDFSSLKESVYRRFIELLQGKTAKQFMLTNKANYISCTTIRGIRVIVIKWMPDEGFEVPFWDDTTVSVTFGTNEQYHQFETKFSKFMPYFKFDRVHVTSPDSVVQLNPVPKIYPILLGAAVSEFVHVDNLLDFLHPGVVRVEVQFDVDCAPATGVTFCNYLMSKLPDMPEFELEFLTERENTTKYLDLLMIPKPTTIVRFVIQTIIHTGIDPLDVTYKDGQWMATDPGEWPFRLCF